MQDKKRYNETRSFLKDESGSATIEAVFIVPLFVLILTAVLYLAFFLYDKCTLERACSMAALRGSQEIWEDNSVRYQKAEEGIADILMNNLLGINKVEQEISVNGDSIYVYLSAKFKWWEFESREEKKIINPIKFIRNCRKAEGVLEK